MITVYKNPNGDTRTASKDVTFEDFQDSNTSHIEDVKAVMEYIADLIESAGELHDCTKKTQEKMFFNDFKHTLETGEDFTKGEWYNLHITAERHHLDAHCPEDVTLIDILEMISDRVCAGMARSGEVYDINLPAEVLQKAVKNTTELIKDRIEVIDPNKFPRRFESATSSTVSGTGGFYTPVEAPQNSTGVVWTDKSSTITVSEGEPITVQAPPYDPNEPVYVFNEGVDNGQ